MSFTEDMQLAVELARGAGKIVLEHYGKVRRQTKTHAAASAEAVTEADRAAQRFIVEGLRKRFPTDGIIGEEDETGRSITFDVSDPAGRNWVIDPIDGTINFIAGLPNFCVSIGLLEQGLPAVGVVYDVTRDQIYRAARGQGAWLGNRRLRALDTPLSDGSVLMSTSNHLDETGRPPGWILRWTSQNIWKIRILGTAALEAVQVAAGVAHGAVTVNGKLWDLAGAAAIVLEAGAVLTDFKGQSIFPFDLTSYSGGKVPFLAAAPKAYAELIKDIQNYP